MILRSWPGPLGAANSRSLCLAALTDYRCRTPGRGRPPSGSDCLELGNSHRSPAPSDRGTARRPRPADQPEYLRGRPAARRPGTPPTETVRRLDTAVPRVAPAANPHRWVARVCPRISFMARYGRPSGKVPSAWAGGMAGCWSRPVIRVSVPNRAIEQHLDRDRPAERGVDTTPIPPRASSPGPRNSVGSPTLARGIR